MGREVVLAVTDGRLDFGTWKRIFQGQTEGLARESRRPAAEAGAGQDYRGIGVLRAILSVVAYGSGVPQERGGQCDRRAGAEGQTLSPGLNCSLEPGGPIGRGQQPIDADEARPASDAGCHVWAMQSY
jgi:hypothetical protein